MSTSLCDMKDKPLRTLVVIHSLKYFKLTTGMLYSSVGGFNRVDIVA